MCDVSSCGIGMSLCGVASPVSGELVVGDGSKKVSVPRVQRDEIRVRDVIAAVSL